MIWWKTGDRLHIRMREVNIDGVVKLASRNGRSLMLEFNGILRGHVGQMPVLLGDDDVFRSVITGDEVELTERRSDD